MACPIHNSNPYKPLYAQDINEIFMFLKGVFAKITEGDRY